MFGWESWEIALASRSKRCFISSDVDSDGRRILTATSRSSRVSLAL